MTGTAESDIQGISQLTATAIPRRTLVAGAAWSVPAIAFAGAAPAFAGASQCIPGTFYPTGGTFTGWTASTGTVLAALQADDTAYAIGVPGNPNFGGSPVSFTANFNWSTLIPNLGGVCSASVAVYYRLGTTGQAGTTYTLTVNAGSQNFTSTNATTTFATAGGTLTTNPTTAPATVQVTASRNNGGSREFWVDYVRVTLSYWTT